MVVVVKVTVRPELAVALTVKSGSPRVLFGREPKVMVWLAMVMEKVAGLAVITRGIVRPSSQ